MKTIGKTFSLVALSLALFVAPVYAASTVALPVEVDLASITASFAKLAIVSILIESIVQTIKPIYDKEKRVLDGDIVLALITSIFVCELTGIDMFKLIDVPLAFPYIGEFLTGVIVSRGSGVVHDLIERITSLLASK